MEQAKHTPEPWHTGGDGTIIYDNAGWGVANATVFHALHNGQRKAKANARRIVACVNALQSVPTEHLEQAVSLGITDALHGNLFSSRLKLQQQRDQLLAAIEAMNHMGGDERGGYCICPLNDGSAPDEKHATICVMARAAIAKATGQEV